jgi:HAD superfamily hydrolase (TIGR01509 family)
LEVNEEDGQDCDGQPLTDLELASLPSRRNVMVDLREALVFDYDGVIADTEPLHWKSWAVLLSRYGIQLGWDEYCRIGQGASDEQIYEHFRARMPHSTARAFAEQNGERKRMVLELSLKESPIAQETVEMLRSLDGYRLGLVTNSDQADVKPVLCAAQIQDRFDAMIFGGDAARPKPSPAPYLLIADRLGVKTGIAFEDSEPGLESARAAGFRTVKIERVSDLSKIVELTLR